MTTSDPVGDHICEPGKGRDRDECIVCDGPIPDPEGGGSSAPPDLPRHLLNSSWQEPRFVVFVWDAPPGWWRRAAHFGNREDAETRAHQIAALGKYVTVAEQTVTHGPMAVLLTAVPGVEAS